MKLPMAEYSAGISLRNPGTHICVVDTSLFSYDLDAMESFLSYHDCVIPPEVLKEIRHVPRWRIARPHVAEIASDIDMVKAAILLSRGPKATLHARISPLLGFAIDEDLTEEDFKDPEFNTAYYYVHKMSSDTLCWHERVRLTKENLDKHFAVSPADVSVVATGMAVAKDSTAVVCADDRDIKFAVYAAREYVPRRLWYAPTYIGPRQ